MFFFDGSGPQNTRHVLLVVRDRLKQGDIAKVLVASESGRLALEVKDDFRAREVDFAPASTWRYLPHSLLFLGSLAQGECFGLFSACAPSQTLSVF